VNFLSLFANISLGTRHDTFFVYFILLLPSVFLFFISFSLSLSAFVCTFVYLFQIFYNQSAKLCFSSCVIKTTLYELFTEISLCQSVIKLMSWTTLNTALHLHLDKNRLDSNITGVNYNYNLWVWIRVCEWFALETYALSP
jgi:hypothetical protein